VFEFECFLEEVALLQYERIAGGVREREGQSRTLETSGRERSEDAAPGQTEAGQARDAAGSVDGLTREDRECPEASHDASLRPRDTRVKQYMAREPLRRTPIASRYPDRQQV